MVKLDLNPYSQQDITATQHKSDALKNTFGVAPQEMCEIAFNIWLSTGGLSENTERVKEREAIQPVEEKSTENPIYRSGENAQQEQDIRKLQLPPEGRSPQRDENQQMKTFLDAFIFGETDKPTKERESFDTTTTAESASRQDNERKMLLPEENNGKEQEIHSAIHRFMKAWIPNIDQCYKDAPRSSSTPSSTFDEELASPRGMVDRDDIDQSFLDQIEDIFTDFIDWLVGKEKDEKGETFLIDQLTHDQIIRNFHRYLQEKLSDDVLNIEESIVAQLKGMQNIRTLLSSYYMESTIHIRSKIIENNKEILKMHDKHGDIYATKRVSEIIHDIAGIATFGALVFGTVAAFSEGTVNLLSGVTMAIVGGWHLLGACAIVGFSTLNQLSDHKIERQIARACNFAIDEALKLFGKEDSKEFTDQEILSGLVIITTILRTVAEVGGGLFCAGGVQVFEFVASAATAVYTTHDVFINRRLKKLECANLEFKNISRKLYNRKDFSMKQIPEQNQHALNAYKQLSQNQKSLSSLIRSIAAAMSVDGARDQRRV